MNLRDIEMRSSGAAYGWEFRWRAPILIGSQPVFAMTVQAVTGFEGHWYAPPFTPWVGWLGVFVAALGVLLRIQSTTALRASVMGADNPDTSHFVRHGIYRSVRNPLYLSSLLLFGGYGLFFGWMWAAGYVAFHFWRYCRIVRLEESCLRSEWNDSFETYFSSVPRWLPRWEIFRHEFGRWMSWHGVIANSLYVGMWLGIAASVLLGNFGWVIPFECAGGVLMLAYYRAQSRKVVASVPGEAKLAIANPELPSTSHASVVASLPHPHFSTEVAERPRVIAIFEEP